MREILAELDRWQREGEEIALATLVAVRRSAPRLTGARLCVTRSGKMAGSVSGGCVENDVFERALRVLATGAPELSTYGISDEAGLAVGLSCGGSIDVLIERFQADDAWEAARAAIESRRPAVLAVALGPAGLMGRKLTVLETDRTAGSIDPGLDGGVIEAATGFLAGRGTKLLTLPHGDVEATVFLEALPPPLRLFVVGATHTAIPLCRMAAILGFRVTIVDPRSPYATGERFPDAEEVARVWPEELLASAALDAYSYVVTLMHDPKFDIPTLALALRCGARYVGAIGSRPTHERRKRMLREEGIDEADLARIRCPIGLDLGGRTSEEIALSILAEIVAVSHGREGGPLRNRQAPINDR